MLSNFLCIWLLTQPYDFESYLLQFQISHSQYCPLSEHSRMYLSTLLLTVTWVMTQFRREINSAALNILLHVFWRMNICTCLCLVYTQNQNCWLQALLMLFLRRCCQTVFKSGFTNFHSHLRCTGVQFILHPCQHLVRSIRKLAASAPALTGGSGYGEVGGPVPGRGNSISKQRCRTQRPAVC